MSEPAVVAASGRPGSSGVAPGPARRWWILGVVGLAQLMVILDATIVNIALPSAQRALGFSNADRQWVVTAYSLAFGGLLLLGRGLQGAFGALLAPAALSTLTVTFAGPAGRGKAVGGFGAIGGACGAL